MLKIDSMTPDVECLPEGECDPRFSALLTAAFPVPEGSTFLDDFPIWKGTHGDLNLQRYVAKVGDRWASVAGVRYARLKLADQRIIPVGLIGAVATSAEFRGRGYASGLVERICLDADQRGVRLLLLWGSEHEMYGRLGFKLSGTQARTPLALLPSRQITMRAGKGWTPEILKRMKMRNGGVVLADSDARWIADHRNVEWRWISHASGLVLAYLAYGRGIDMTGLIHEWGGDSPALEELFSFALQEWPQAELLGEPRELKKRGWIFDQTIHENLCLARWRGEGSIPEFWIWGLDAV